MSRSERRGFTLVEMLVYMAILSLLLSGIYMLLVGGLGFVRDGSAYQTAQQQALVGMRWLSSETCNSTRVRRSPALGPTTNSTHLIFLSPDPIGGGSWTYSGAELEYQKYVCFFWDSASSQLIRTEQALSSPAISILTDPPPSLATMQAIPEPDRRVIARQITDLRINEGSTPDQIVFEITGEEATSWDRSTRVTFRTQIRMENN